MTANLENMFGEEPESDEISDVPEGILDTGEGVMLLDEEAGAEERNKQWDRENLERLDWHRGMGVSEKQFKWIKDMLLNKQLSDSDRSACDWKRLGSITRAEASQWIGRLKSLPDRARTRSRGSTDPPSPTELPRGRYAIERGGTLCFYNVWRGTRRPEYVKVYQQFGPEDKEVPYFQAMNICKAIVAAGALEAAQRYGKEIGHCYACGLRLTNRLSRELGIGPICGGRGFGDRFKEMAKEARKSLKDQGLDPDEKIED